MSPQWEHTTHGLMQGCPFSMMLIAAVMTVWVQEIRLYVADGLRIRVFVDDRTLWAVGATAHRRIWTAVECGDCIDQRFGLRQKRDKLQLAANTQYLREALCAIFQATTAYATVAVKAELVVLGIQYALSAPGVTSLAPRSAKKLERRLMRIAVASQSPHVRALLYRSVARPTITWAGAYASLNGSTVHRLLPMVLKSLAGRTSCSSSRYLRATALANPTEDLVFAMDTAILATCARHICRRAIAPQWMRTTDGIAYLASDPASWLPRVRQVLDQHGWSWHPTTDTIQLNDGPNPRYFRFGWDGISALTTWRLDRWHTRMFANEKRAFESYMRDTTADSDIAIGMRPPPPPTGSAPVISEHRRVAQDPLSNVVERTAALGSGTSVWHCLANKYIVGRADKTHLEKCMCGLRMPSMPHLLWTCESTAHLRHHIELPQNRGEERLLCKTLPLAPPPYCSTMQAPTNPPTMRAWLLKLDWICENGHAVLPIGTDGGAKAGCAAGGCATLRDSYALPMEGEDAAPLAAEMYAIMHLLSTLLLCCDNLTQRLGDVQRRVIVVSDCKPAWSLATAARLNSRAADSRWKVVQRLNRTLRLLPENDFSIEFSWVPSHDKTILPHRELGEAYMRDLNKAADTCVTDALRIALDASGRGTWEMYRQQACNWSKRALAHAADVGLQHRQYLEQLAEAAGSRPPHVFA